MNYVVLERSHIHVRIFVRVVQLNIILGFCTVLYGGLLGSETVSTGSFDTCAEILFQSVFTLPEPLLGASYCMILLQRRH